MGWWGHDVLSGDGPLDVLDTLARQAGLVDPAVLGVYPHGRVDDPHARQAVVELLAGRDMGGWEELAAALPGTGSDDMLVWQVLGAVALAAGVALPEPVRDRIDRSAAEDLWAQTDPARRAAMDRFRAALAVHRDTPTVVASSTVGDAMGRARQVGHTGLLNLPGPP